MIKRRRQSREIALQSLYLADVTPFPKEKALDAVCYRKKVDPTIVAFAKTLFDGTRKHQDALDPLIQKYAQNWELKRMASIDRNLLRMAAFELIHQTDTPPTVIINEAVDIAKDFSTPDSGKFVNGILDQLKKERPEKKPD